MILRRINKKGEEVSGPGPLIAAVIAGFVLVIVIVGVWIFFSGKLPFFEYLPDFNQTKPRIIDSEIFRYIIETDNLQYYDGNQWSDFKSGTSIETNGKKFDAFNLGADIIRPYVLETTKIDGIDVIILPKTSASVEYTRWEATIKLWGLNPSDSIDILGGGVLIRSPVSGNTYHLDLNGKLMYLTSSNTLEEVSNSTMQGIKDRITENKTFLGKVSNWRESLINNQVTIKYSINDGDKDIPQTPITTCYFESKYFDSGNRALVVDLSRPLKVGESCPYD